MRYFEIVKPSTKHLSSDTDPREASAGEPRSGGMKPAGELGTANPLASQDLTQSAVTSVAFITPAFAIAQGSVCPRN